MSNDSPRPSKRQKVGLPFSSPQTPQSAKRSYEKRSILTYGSGTQPRKLRSAVLELRSSPDPHAGASHKESNDSYDSATYQSTNATEYELFDTAAEEVDTPSRRSRKPRKKDFAKEDHIAKVRIGPSSEGPATRGQKSTEGGIESLPAGTETHTTLNEDSRSDGDTITVRSSGRARKKTWKSAAAESEAAVQSVRKSRASSLKRALSPAVDPIENDHVAQSRPRNKTDVRSTPAKHASVQLVGTPQSQKRRGRPPKQRTTLEDLKDVTAPKSTPEANRKGQKGNSTTRAEARENQSSMIIPMNGRPGDASHPATSPTVEVEVLEGVSSAAAALEAAIADLSALIEDQNYSKDVDALKMEVLVYITNRGLKPIVGGDHCKAYWKIHQVLEQTIAAGEGNSMLVIGARGTAKTVLVETALSRLTSERPGDFHVVRLSGFFQTDDKLALKEIWRQLGKEMNVDDGSMDDRGNYADTMASLLALLSQPEELAAQEEIPQTASKSVVFILDEFDLFTSHPRQTLLYNLFDIAQSRKAPIAVLGLTTRVDVVESLEKRVRSRFSHRYVHLSHAKSLSAFTDICKAFLLALPSDNDDDSSTATMYPPTSLLNPANSSKLYSHFILTAWRTYVDALLSTVQLTHILRRNYLETKSTSSFLNSFLLPFASLSPSGLPTASSFVQLNSLPLPDSKLDLLPSLSDLELALLISAARLDIILDTDTCNFNMAYDEYTSLAQRARMQTSVSGAIAIGGNQGAGGRVWGREVSMGAWERLEDLGLLLPAETVGRGGAADTGRGGRLLRADVSLEEIRDSGLEALQGTGLGSMGRWCKEI